jgi:hypothetical protein
MKNSVHHTQTRKDERDKRLEDARRKSLESQRQCAWCERRFPDSDALIDHIIATHT